MSIIPFKLTCNVNSENSVPIQICEKISWIREFFKYFIKFYIIKLENF